MNRVVNKASRNCSSGKCLSGIVDAFMNFVSLHWYSYHLLSHCAVFQISLSPVSQCATLPNPAVLYPALAKRWGNIM